MRISFDLDETLICHALSVPCENGWGPTVARSIFGEPLRRGARQMFKQLKTEGHEVWIYTTSMRSEFRIQIWLWLHGVLIDGIINFSVHNETPHAVRSLPTPSKYPPTFGIDLHVDDLEGVHMEGLRHGFSVLVIHPSDADWCEKVIACIRGRITTAGKSSSDIRNLKTPV
jgi:hypothetical protein